MDLFLDTTEYGQVTFALDNKKKTYQLTPQESDKILEYLQQFLKTTSLHLSPNLEREIKRIVIYKGQGSFTGLRIAASIAQALGLAWQIPVKVIKK